jgi:hypothetical protein
MGRFKLAFFMVMFAVLGMVLLFTTRAATPFASLEAEQGITAGAVCNTSDLSASGTGNNAVQFGGCTSSGGSAKPPDSSSNGLVAKSGDKEIQLSWTAVPGATSYRIERIDVSNWAEQQSVYTLPEDQQFKSLKTGVTQTSYLDSPATFAAPGGRGLVNGQTYTYRVISDNGVTRGPVKQMPDDGYELAGWTAINGNSAKKRDARNTGHWGKGLQTKDLRRIEGNYYIQPGETLDGVLVTGTVFTVQGQGITIKNSWIRHGVFGGNGNPNSILVEDTTFGPGPGQPDSSYDNNGILSGPNITCRRCRTMWVGGVFFAQWGNATIEDTFSHDTYAYEPPGGDAHLDVVWVQNSSGPITVRRSNLECSANCSAVLGPGTITSGAYIVEDNLFNGGGQTVVVNSLYQLRRNRFKRSPSGFYENGALFCTFDVSYGYPGVDEDNSWIDNGQAIKGTYPYCY